MTKARQEATIKKIERNVAKHIPKTNDTDFLVDGYDDEMGENIEDLESEEESEGIQRAGQTGEPEASRMPGELERRDPHVEGR